ncbi:MAG: ABC transporter permease [Gammaproteobacteria bacterium]|nr:ABC transporter permease [Gammaproteobacteria bacterium]
MNLGTLALKSLWSRRIGVALTLAGITLSVALILGVDRIRVEAREHFLRTVSGTDLIVGARTSPVQVLLYSVFRMGDPTGNINWKTFQQISSHPKVRFAIPVSLGDSHRGYRVLGTTDAYFQHLGYGDGQKLRFQSGRGFEGVLDTVLGSEVAAILGYQVEDKIIIAHGTRDDGLARHDDMPFTVTGVLAPTGTPVDRTVHVSLAGIEAIHVGWETGVHRPGAGVANVDPEGLAPREPKTITAFFLGLNNRMDVFLLQRAINAFPGEPLTAILPGVALQSLWDMFGTAEAGLVVVTVLTLITGVLGMLAGILATLNERRREIAVFRAVGARPRDIFVLLVAESTLLAFTGALFGLLLLTLVAAGLGEFAMARYGLAPSAGLPSVREWGLLGGIVLAGSVAGLIPAWRAYRQSLHDGLSTGS